MTQCLGAVAKAVHQHQLTTSYMSEVMLDPGNTKTDKVPACKKFRAKQFNFDDVKCIKLLFYDSCFCYCIVFLVWYSGILCLTYASNDFLLFSFKSCIVLVFIFMFMIHFELIFVCGVMAVIHLIACGQPIVQCHLLKILHILSKISHPYMWYINTTFHFGSFIKTLEICYVNPPTFSSLSNLFWLFRAFAFSNKI